MVIAVLFFLTAAAFVYSQRLKREPLVIDRVDYVVLGGRPGAPGSNIFSPNGDCRNDRMGIYFRTTRSDRMDVEVIRREGEPVRTLASDRFFRRYREHSFIWNGRDDRGALLPTGPYLVRVTMLGMGRVLELPGRIRLRRFPPRESACPTAEAGSPREAAG